MLTGPRDAASAAFNLDRILTVSEKIDPKLYGYLCPPKIQTSFPLPKYLILTAVLSSSTISNDEKKKIDVKKYIKDSWMLHWLKEYELI